jgi:hypothetical protein
MSEAGILFVLDAGACARLVSRAPVNWGGEGQEVVPDNVSNDRSKASRPRWVETRAAKGP